MSLGPLLLDLPVELLVHILAHLSFSDLASCQRVNHSLRDLIKTDVSLQYLTELQVAAIENNPYTTSRSIVDRLQLLREKENAWECLDFTRTSSIDIKHNPSGIYDLAGGIFLLGESLRQVSPAWKGTDALRYLRLSSAIAPSNLSERHDPTPPMWPRIDLQASIVDIGMAAQEHDLIAVVTHAPQSNSAPYSLVTLDIHLVKLSTGHYHPAASNPVIHISDVMFSPGQCGISVEIVGGTLGILLHRRSSNHTRRSVVFRAYDWKSGRMTFVRHASSADYNAFSFVSPDVIVLPNLTAHTLELCRLSITSANNGKECPAELETACSLALPPLAATSLLFKVWCRSEPNPFGPAGQVTHRNCLPFYSDPAQAIMIFSVVALEGDHLLHSLSLVIHRASLLAKLPTHSSARDLDEIHGSDLNPLGDSTEDQCSKIPWTSWGPAVCRWFDANDHATRWITTSCGQRYVTISRHVPAPVKVYDFNHTAIRRFMQKRRRVATGDEVDLIEYVDPETKASIRFQMGSEILSSPIFEEPIVSTVPYMVSTTREEYEYESVLMDEGMMIGVKLTSSKDDICELVVHSVGPHI